MACQVQVRDFDPPLALPATLSAAGETPPLPLWWRQWDDPVLDTLIQQALTGNLTLKSAHDRIEQAEAVARRAGADLQPTLDARAGVSRNWTHRRVPAGTPDGQRFETERNTNHTLGLAAGYEVDLWGRIRSTRNAAALEAEAQRLNLQTAAITLSASIASVWYELIEQHGQLRLLDEQTATNRQTLEVIETRFRRSQASAVDVLQQRQLIESRLGARALVEARIGVLRHALAVLQGRAPTDTAFEVPETLIDLPALPAPGLPGELLRRRPDLQAAYIAIQAADQRAAAAVADRYPRLSLSAEASTEDNEIRDLFDNWAATLAANAVAPILDGGQRRAEVERTRAATREAIHDYAQTALEALAEVEDALIRERQQWEYIQSLGRQVELAGLALTETTNRYLNGASEYLRVLDAQESLQNLQRTLLQARRERIGFRIDLHRAIAGGWDADPSTPLMDPYAGQSTWSLAKASDATELREPPAGPDEMDNPQP